MLVCRYAVGLLAFGLPLMAAAEALDRAPADLGDGWAVGKPSEAGLDPEALAGLVADIEKGILHNVHAVLIERDGRLVFERYWSGDDALAKTPGFPRELAFPLGLRPGNPRTPRRKRRGPVFHLHRGCAALGRQGGSFVAASPSLAPVALRAAGPHAPQPEIKYLATRCGIRHHNGILEPIRHP